MALKDWLPDLNKVGIYKERLMGKHQSEVRDILGEWWTLSRQTDYRGGFINHFLRNVQGELNVYIDENNMVYNVTGYYYGQNI